MVKRKNWETLKAKLAEEKQNEPVTGGGSRGSTAETSSKKRKRKHTEISDAVNQIHNGQHQQEQQEANQTNEIIIPGHDLPHDIKANYIGLDCEMVGIGSTGKKSALARCCLVDFDGNKLYDQFVRPKSFVTDFRTKYSGVRKSDLREGVAVTLEECMADVAKLINGKILVGHALSNDLDVLMLSHPRSKIRDTATFKPYMRPHGRRGGKFRPRALRDLSRQHLKQIIQEGEHDPGIDASAAMMLYRMKRDEWEKSLRLAAKLRREKNFTSSAKANQPSSSKSSSSRPRSS